MGCGTLLSLALTAGGAAAGEVGASQAKNNENAVVQQYLNAQNKYGKQGQALLGQSMNASTPEAAAQQVAQGQSQYLNAARNATAVPLGLPTAATTSTDQAVDRARTDLGNQAMANFAGYGNYGFQQGLKDQNIGAQLGANNALSGIAGSYLPAELGQASQSGAGWDSLGSLLSGLGTLAGGAGAAGLFGQSAVPLQYQLGSYGTGMFGGG